VNKKAYSVLRPGLSFANFYPLPADH
jgi:hypothetical protein